VPHQVLIYVPDGVSASEYDFLRFRINSDNREFRVLTGGVFHSTGGADRDEVPFKPVKTAARTYQFTVEKDTGGGEYGILPPRHRQRHQWGKGLHVRYCRVEAQSGPMRKSAPAA
jgi:hypothetical protein